MPRRKPYAPFYNFANGPSSQMPGINRSDLGLRWSQLVWTAKAWPGLELPETLVALCLRDQSAKRLRAVLVPRPLFIPRITIKGEAD